MKHLQLLPLAMILLGLIGPRTLSAEDVQSQKDKNHPISINVLELKPGWWKALSSQEESLKKQSLDGINRHLQSLKNQSKPLEDSEEAVSLIQRASNTLNAYQKRFFETSEVDSPSVTVFLENYTLSDIQDLLTKHPRKAQQQQLFENELEQLKTQLKDLEKANNNIMANYLEVEDNGPEKLKSGLKILVNQLSKAVLQLRVDQHTKQINTESKKLERLEEELSHAKKSFQITAKDQKQIRKRIVKLEKSLQTQIKSTLQLEKKSLSAPRESSLGQAEANLIQYEWVRASINEAGIKIELMQERVREKLALLQIAPEENPAQKIQKKITEWKAELSEIQQSIKTWSNHINQASQVASVALSDLTDEQSNPLKRIHKKQLDLAEKTTLEIKTIKNEEVILSSLLEWLSEENGKRQQSIQKVFSYGQYAIVASWEQIYEWMQQSLFTIGEIPVTPFGIARVILILFMAILISRIVRSSLKRTRSLGLSDNSVYTLSRLLHYAILTIGLFVGLSSVGIDFSQFALIAGALSVGIGFGLQSIISNFVSGIILLFERPLRIGDLVELESGVKGNVKSINVRSTLIHTWDGIDILVPNSEFIVGKVTNWTFQDPIRRLHVPFGVSYNSDKDLVKKAALEAADRVPYTITPEPGKEPAVWMKGFGDNSIDFELVVWVDPQRTKGNESLQALYLWELHTSLTQYEIEIPFPQRDLHLKSGFDSLTSAVQEKV